MNRCSVLLDVADDTGRENGVRYQKPKRPEGCFAFLVPDPLFQQVIQPLWAVTEEVSSRPHVSMKRCTAAERAPNSQKSSSASGFRRTCPRNEQSPQFLPARLQMWAKKDRYVSGGHRSTGSPAAGDDCSHICCNRILRQTSNSQAKCLRARMSTHSVRFGGETSNLHYVRLDRLRTCLFVRTLTSWDC